jgi:hypothetical protein
MSACSEGAMKSLRKVLQRGGLLVVLVATGQAQQAATSPAAETSTKKATQSAALEQGKPVKQAVTLREPTPEEIRTLLEGMAAYVNDSPEGLTVVQQPDGTLWLDHQGRFQNVSVAKTNADGSVSVECATSLAQARRFLVIVKVKATLQGVTRTIDLPVQVE